VSATQGQNPGERQRWHYPGTAAVENLRPSEQNRAVGLAGLLLEIPSLTVPGSFLNMTGKENFQLAIISYLTPMVGPILSFKEFIKKIIYSPTCP
jgi:hypothetical protein